MTGRAPYRDDRRWARWLDGRLHVVVFAEIGCTPETFRTAAYYRARRAGLALTTSVQHEEGHILIQARPRKREVL